MSHNELIWITLVVIVMTSCALSAQVTGISAGEDRCNPLLNIGPGSLFKKTPSGLTIFRDIRFAINVR